MVMSTLQNHMLTARYFDAFINPISKETKIVRKNTTSESIKKDINKNLSLDEEDKLFWLFFVIHNGYDTYLNTKRTFYNEKQLKFSIIDEIKECKDVLKKHKIKLSSLIEDIGTNHIISVNTFIGLSCVYSKNVCLLRGKLMACYNFNKTTSDYYIINCDNLTMFCDTQNITCLENMYVIVNNLDKPFKSVTTYKKQELIDIASKFNIDTVNNTTKKQKTKLQIYQEILENI